MTKVREGRVTLEVPQYDKDIYPREKWSTHTIEEYADALRAGAQFPPIILEDGTDKILDGVHRWKAYLKYQAEYSEHEAQAQLIPDGNDWAQAPTEIAVEWHQVPEGIPALLYAASMSARHGDRLTGAERKALARKIFTDNPDFTLETLTEYLPVSKSSASDYVADIRARRKEAQTMVALRLDRLGWTQDEIAEATGVSQPNLKRDILYQIPELENDIKKLLVSGIPPLDVAERYNMPLILVWAISLAGLTDAQRMTKLNINVQPYDVWHFTKCHELFGSEHPGRIPGDLVAHALYFFTEPGDTVVDPMAGSGTTQDVCLAMGRKCYAYDIDDRHGRPDTISHNIAKDGWPDRVKKADLIFWDPPYFQKMDKLNIGDDGYIDGSISGLERAEYLAFFGQRLAEARAMVRKGTRLTFLMSDWDDDTGEREGIFLWDYANILDAAGWKLRRHIQTPLSTQQVHPDIVNKFRSSRRLARLERYLLVAEA